MADELTLDMARGKVLIFDEVDLLIDEFIAVFVSKPSLEVKGLIVSKVAKKTYMLSAIEEKIHSAFFSSVLKMNYSQKLDFPSMLSLHDKTLVDINSRIDKYVVRDNV